MNRETFLEDLEAKTITLFGQSKNFAFEEMVELLALDKISLVKEITPDTALLIRGRLLNPLLEAEIDAVERRGEIDTLEIELFEELLSASLHEEGLLMSLKLSADPSRLLSYLCNSMLSDRVFISLLSLHRWNDASLFENDENRDVCASITRRFYDNVQRNHNVEYSPVGIFQTAMSSSNSDLLEALFHLQPIKKAFANDSKSIEHQILQALSRNTSTPASVLYALAKEDDGRLAYYLAQNSAIDEASIDVLIESEDRDVLVELAGSSLLKDSHRDVLFEKEAALLNDIVAVLVLDEKSFQRVLKQIKALPKAGLNESLTSEMIERLLALDLPDLTLNLASNRLLKEEQMQGLYEANTYELLLSMASNPALTQTLLEAFYDQKDENINRTLASNPMCTAKILEALAASKDESVVQAVAANPNTPLDTLYQLHLDMRYASLVKANPSFGEQIWNQLGF